MRDEKAKRALLGALSICAVLLLWQGLAQIRLASGVELPGPVAVGLRAFDLRSDLLFELVRTLRRAFLGLTIAALTMVPLGLLVGRIRLLRNLITPIVEILRPLPTPAVIPFVMLIAGISDTAKVGIVFFGVTFPILLSTISGVGAIHPTAINAARTLGLAGPERFFFVYLPSAFPQISAGIRTSIPLALLISVTAEMLMSTDGIGVFLRKSQESFRMADGLAAIVLLALCALAISRLNTWMERKLLFWHIRESQVRT